MTNEQPPDLIVLGPPPADPTAALIVLRVALWNALDAGAPAHTIPTVIATAITAWETEGNPHAR